MIKQLFNSVIAKPFLTPQRLTDHYNCDSAAHLIQLLVFFFTGIIPVYRD